MSCNRIVLVLYSIIILLCCSCEKKQSKKKTQHNPNSDIKKESRKTTQKVVDSNELENKSNKKDTVVQEKDFKLSNKNLRDFFKKYGKENPETQVRITTIYGSIDIQLSKKTPIHRANFIYLVKQKYFDETFFYRVAKGFVIQGGNSDRRAMSKKRFEIGDYTLAQEQDPKLKHYRGAVALSKLWEDNPSNRSTPFEFFIVVAKNGAHHLDGEHTVFGKVIRGMRVADKISNVPVDSSEWPKENIFITAEVIR